MKKTCILSVALIMCFMAQAQRPLTTYAISTKVSQTCVSIVSLALFEEGSGNDSLNKLLIEEYLGNFMQSKNLRKVDFFYKNRQFIHPDSTFDFTIFGGLTFAKNDLFSFTVCPRYACDKTDENTFETQMMTLDASSGRFLEMKDFFDPKVEDTLSSFVYRVVTMYHLRNLPVCKIMGMNPNTISTTSGNSTITDTITYIKGLSGKFYLDNDKMHLYLRVKHRDYDYNDVEIALPYSKLKYFMRPEMIKRLGLG